MKLNVVSKEDGLTSVESVGDITVFDLSDRENPLETLLGIDCYRQTVLLDLAQSTYIDSSGVGWLIQCHTKFQHGGGRLVVHSIAPMVNHCFRVLGVYDVLNVASDKAVAMALASAR